MRKISTTILLVLISLLVFSCSDDKHHPEDPFWGEEDLLTDQLAINAIELDGQLDEAVISVDLEQPDVGVISVLLDIDVVSLSEVELMLIDSPQKSTISVKKGDILNFSESSPIITVTSPKGEKREYTIEYTTPAEYDYRTPSAFRMAEQVGETIIEDDEEDDSKGVISVEFESRYVDLTAVELTELELPYGATADIEVGGRLDLSSDENPASFVVTALSGVTRTYTINYALPPASDERTPLEFKLNGQLGVEIVDNPTDDAKGTITLTYQAGTDLSKLLVEELELPLYATSNIEVGDELNLTGGTAELIVTSESEKIRTYTINIYEIAEVDDLVGTYRMVRRFGQEDWEDNAVIIEGGVEDNAIWMNLYDKNWSWGGGGESNIRKVNDYKIVFELTSVDEETIGGRVTLTAGPGGYCDFTWGDGTDVSDMYQVIPKGASRWEKELSSGLIKFYNNSGEYISQCTRIESGVSLTADHVDNKVFTIGDDEYAFHNEIVKDGWWNGPDYWGDKSRYVDNCRRVMWMVKKAE